MNIVSPEPGMTRDDVEALLGRADYERAGWQAHYLGHPRWEPFAFDYDVFEIRYKEDRLVETRVRST